MCSLLRLFFRTIIDAFSQEFPCLLKCLIISTITGLNIFLQPILASEAFGTPREFVKQFVHHRIVFDTFRSDTYPFHSLRSTSICLGIVESVNQNIHLAMQTHVSTEVQEHTIRPIMLHEAILSTPFRPSIAPLRTTFCMKVEHQHIAGLAVLNHRNSRIFLPCLNHPNRFRTTFLHGIHNCLTCRIQVYSRSISSFVERVHGIELRLAIEFSQLFIIKVRNFLETFIFRLQERRTIVTAPQTRIGYIQAQLFLGIMRYHATITWQNRMNTIFTHPLHNLLLQFGLLNIPTIRIRATPPFQVIH